MKKQLKKLTSVLLAAILVIGMVLALPATASASEDGSYRIMGDISFGETKTLQSDTCYRFVPEKNLTLEIEGADDTTGKVVVFDSDMNSIAGSYETVMCSVTAGETYYIGYIDGDDDERDITIGGMENPALGEPLKVTLNNNLYSRFIFTPEHDMFLRLRMENGTDGLDCDAYNNKNKSVQPINSYSTEGLLSQVFSVSGGESYRFEICDNYMESDEETVDLCLDEIVAEQILPGEEKKFDMEENGIKFFALTPEKDLLVSASCSTYYTVYDGELNEIKSIGNDDFRQNNYMLNGGNTYYIECTCRDSVSDAELSFSEIETKAMAFGESDTKAIDSYVEYNYAYSLESPKDCVVEVKGFREDGEESYFPFVVTDDKGAVTTVELGDTHIVFGAKEGKKYYVFINGTAYDDYNYTVTLNEYTDFTDVGLGEETVCTSPGIYRLVPERPTLIIFDNQLSDDYLINEYRICDSEFKEIVMITPYLAEAKKPVYLIVETIKTDKDYKFTFNEYPITQIKKDEETTCENGDYLEYVPDKDELLSIESNAGLSVYVERNGVLERFLFVDSHTYTMAAQVGKRCLIYVESAYGNTTLKLTAKYPLEKVDSYEEVRADIEKADGHKLFLFTPGRDMTAKLQSRLLDDTYTYNTPTAYFGSYSNESESEIEAKAGNTYYVVAGFKYSYQTGSTGTMIVDPGRITEGLEAYGEAREGEYTVSFNYFPEDDKLVRLSVLSDDYHNIGGVTAVSVSDEDGNIISRRGRYDKEALAEVKAGKKYIVSGKVKNTDTIQTPCLLINEVPDIVLGEKMPESDLFRFVPDEDTLLSGREISEDGEKSAYINFYDSEFNEIKYRDEDTYLLDKGKTYFISLFTPEEVIFSAADTISLNEKKQANSSINLIFEAEKDMIIRVESENGNESVDTMILQRDGRILASSPYLSGGKYLYPTVEVKAGEKYIIRSSYLPNSGDEEIENYSISVVEVPEYEIKNNILVRYNGNKTEPTVSGVTGVGDRAFIFKELSKLSEPLKVKSIGKEAFYRCNNLESLKAESGLEEIGDSAFFGCSKNTDVSLPDTVSKIGEQAFSHNSFETFRIPASVTEITYAAFACNDRLAKADIPANVKRIGRLAYGVDTALEEVNISEGVTEIEKNAFLSCSSLKSITIPKSVTKIGDNALGYKGRIFFDYEEKELKLVPDSLYEDFSIRGYKGTAAETYAKENDITFIALDGEDDKRECGDMTGDGKITIDDATMIQKSLAELITLTPEQKAAADTNADGKVDINDATQIQKYLAELVDHLG